MQHLGATVDNALLSAIAGSRRRLLAGRDDLPGFLNADLKTLLRPEPPPSAETTSP